MPMTWNLGVIAAALVAGDRSPRESGGTGGKAKATGTAARRQGVPESGGRAWAYKRLRGAVAPGREPLPALETGSSRSRSASPSMLKPKTASDSATAGRARLLCHRLIPRPSGGIAERAAAPQGARPRGGPSVRARRFGRGAGPATQGRRRPDPRVGLPRGRRQCWLRRDVDEYVSFATDTAGPAALVLRGLPEDERDALRAQLGEAFAPFVAAGGYELPGVALTAVAS